jgi:hypothetical protein
MAKNNGPMDSPQDSLVGNRPSKHGGDQAIQSLHLPYVDDPPTKGVTGETFYVDIPGEGHGKPTGGGR